MALADEEVPASGLEEDDEVDLSFAGPEPVVPTAPWHLRLFDLVSAYLPLVMMAVLAAGTWWLDANNDGSFGAGDYTYGFGGLPGDIPVVGDWNGVAGVSTHKSCIGIYRTQGSVWLLDLNCNGSFENTPTDAFFPFGGLAGDVPVVGNFTGGTTRVGVVRKYAPAGVPQGEPFFWVYDAGNANAGNAPANHPPAAASAFPFGGLPGDQFVVGDWLDTGTARAGVYRGGLWVLDSNGLHNPDLILSYGGLPSDKAVTGKW